MKKAFDMGYDAHLGIGDDINPFAIGSSDFEEWENGYALAASDSDADWDNKEVEPMGKRKSLNDVLSNDRSVARAAQKFDSPANYNTWGKPSAATSSGWGGGGKYAPRCYESHPPLKIGDFEIYGGSCITPIVTNADVYIGFDRAMSISARAFPWNEGAEVFFPISDMKVPTNLTEFKKLLEWTHEQLKAGKKVHAGCIGGHGRTGMFFAALVKHILDEDDAIEYVRKHYCKKVVESHEQVEWLHKNFGIKKAEATKGLGAGWSTKSKGSYGSSGSTASGSGIVASLGRSKSLFATK